mgnify:CR=1 FL=1
MENIIKHKISRNILSTNYGKISPNRSNSSDLIPNDYQMLTNNNKIYRKNIFKKEIKNDFKKEKNIMNFSSDKIVFGNTINHNDIKYVFEKSNNSFMNNFQSIKPNSESNKLLDNYLMRLKNFGFPELGEIYLSSEISEQEKTFSFFDYLISKETNNIEMNDIKEKKIEENIKKNKDLTKIISQLSDELNLKENKLIILDKKLEEQKDYYEQQVNSLIKENEYLKEINNKISIKKKNLESKLHTINKTLNKYQNMKSNIINAVEIIDQVQNNDMTKMLARVKNTEKLIESLKGEYNESLRELTSQINFFKDFILGIYNEICILIGKSYNLDDKIYNLPFLDFVNYLKKVFKKNLEIMKEKIYISDNEESF